MMPFERWPVWCAREATAPDAARWDMGARDPRKGVRRWEVKGTWLQPSLAQTSRDRGQMCWCAWALKSKNPLDFASLLSLCRTTVSMYIFEQKSTRPKSIFPEWLEPEHQVPSRFLQGPRRGNSCGQSGVNLQQELSTIESLEYKNACCSVFPRGLPSFRECGCP